MYMCNSNHDEVVYEGSNCPVCEQLDSVKRLVDEIGFLKNRILDLEDTITGLESRIEDLGGVG